MKKQKNWISIVVLAAFLFSIMNVPVLASEVEPATRTAEQSRTVAISETEDITELLDLALTDGSETARGSTVEESETAVMSGTCGDNLAWELVDGLLTISGTGNMANYREDMVTVPWLDYKTDIKKVIVESGVTSIGDYSFEGCGNLAEIALPTGITAIGDYAFKNCDALAEITIPKGVISLGDYAFSYADSLGKITIPASVSKIGTHSFYSCNNLETVSVEGDLDTIGEYAFAWCSKLETVSISGTVSGIGEWAFWDCTSLEEISAKSITGEIGSYAFYQCSAIEKINASLDGLTSIDYRAFEDCISLTELILPESLVRINDYAFSHCGLEEIIIPDSVTRIGGHAFESCYKLKNVVLSSNATDYATEIGIAANLFYDCPYLQTVTISNDMIEVIAENAFGKCSGLTDIYFAGSLNQWNCITVEAGNETLTSDKLTVHCQALDEEILLEGTYGESVGHPVNWTLTRGGTLTFSGTGPVLLYVVENAGYIVKTLVIEDGITAIQDYSARNFVNMDTLFIADSVMSIDYNTFVDCKKLKDVYYAGSPTQWECLAAEIADSVTIHCEASDDEILASGSWGGNGTWELTRGGVLDIHGSAEILTAKNSSWMEYQQFITEAIIGDGVMQITDSAFNNCVNLQSVYIPDSVESIQYSFNGFYGCPVTDVYYEGSPEEWAEIEKDSNLFSNATIHYGRENDPVQQLEPAFSAFVALDGNQTTTLDKQVSFYAEIYDTSGKAILEGKNILVWAETPAGIVTDAMHVERYGAAVSKSDQFENVYLLSDAMHGEIFEISFNRAGAYTIYAGVLNEGSTSFTDVEKLSCGGFSEILVRAVNPEIAIQGDVNLDSEVNMDDVVALLNHVVKADTIIDSAALAAGEVTSDTELNMDDVVKLLNYVVKAIDSLD